MCARQAPALCPVRGQAGGAGEAERTSRPEAHRALKCSHGQGSGRCRAACLVRRAPQQFRQAGRRIRNARVEHAAGCSRPCPASPPEIRRRHPSRGKRPARDCRAEAARARSSITHRDRRPDRHGPKAFPGMSNAHSQACSERVRATTQRAGAKRTISVPGMRVSAVRPLGLQSSTTSIVLNWVGSKLIKINELTICSMRVSPPGVRSSDGQGTTVVPWKRVGMRCGRPAPLRLVLAPIIPGKRVRLACRMTVPYAHSEPERRLLQCLICRLNSLAE